MSAADKPKFNQTQVKIIKHLKRNTYQTADQIAQALGITPRKVIEQIYTLHFWGIVRVEVEGETRFSLTLHGEEYTP